MDGDHADLVVGVLDHHRLEAAARLDDFRHLVEQGRVGAVQAQGEGLVLGHHHELRQVDGVRALAQDLALRALLAAGFEEPAGVLEVGVVGVAGQGLVGVKRCAAAAEDIADPALGNGHQGMDVQAELEREEEVQAAAQDVGLEAGLPAQGDDAGLDRAGRAPQLLHHRHPAVADVADHAGAGEERQGDQDKHKRAQPGRDT